MLQNSIEMSVGLPHGGEDVVYYGDSACGGRKQEAQAPQTMYKLGKGLDSGCCRQTAVDGFTVREQETE
jgi:hypothetical protein